MNTTQKHVHLIYNTGEDVSCVICGATRYTVVPLEYRSKLYKTKRQYGRHKNREDIAVCISCLNKAAIKVLGGKNEAKGS